MQPHPHVRELIRFEEQALGASIFWSDDDQPVNSAVALRPPARDGSAGAHPVPEGTPPVRRDGAVVTLAFDPNALAASGDRAKLGQLWETAVSPALAEAARHLRETAEREQLDAFVALEERVWRDCAARLPAAIDNLEYSVSRAEDQLREHILRLGDLRRQHRAASGVSREVVLEGARQQLVALRRLAPNTYSSVAIRAERIVGVIERISIDTDDSEVDVGRFEVTVDVVSAEISIRNLTNAVDGIQHPHVRSPGDICWGNIRPGIVRLLAEREWAGLFTVIHRFLHSYAPNDAYIKAEAFDPDMRDSEDEEDDEEDSNELTCDLCGDNVAHEDATTVRGTLVCPDCVERDTFTCAGCRVVFTSREQARASLQCTSCWDRSHFTCVACHEVKALAERQDMGTCLACHESGAGRGSDAPAIVEVAS